MQPGAGGGHRRLRDDKGNGLNQGLDPAPRVKVSKGSALWDRLLAGRSADLLVSMDSPPWYYRWVAHMPGHHQMRRAILEFSGIRPVRVHSFGPVLGAEAARRQRWLRAPS